MENDKLLKGRKYMIRRLIEIKSKEELKNSLEGDTSKLIPPEVAEADRLLISNLNVLTFVDGSQFRNLLFNILFDGYLQNALVSSQSSSEPVYLYLEELVMFCIAAIKASDDLRKKIHDLLYGKLFGLCKVWRNVDTIVKYEFYRSAQIFQQSEEEEWKVLECLLPIAKELGKMEEVLQILEKMKQMNSENKEVVIRCNFDILKVYESIRESKESEEEQKKYDDRIVQLVLDFTSQEDLLSPNIKMNLLRKYSIRYRNHKELQNLVPEHDASQNYFKAGLEILKLEGGDLDEADELFDESIRKDQHNLYAHEGKREILKKKIVQSEEQQQVTITDGNREKLCHLCFLMYQRFFEIMDRKKKIDLMNDVIQYSPLSEEEKEGKEDLRFLRLQAVHNRDVMLLRRELENNQLDLKKERSFMETKMEKFFKQLEMMEKVNIHLSQQTEHLKLTVLKLSRNKREKKIVVLDTRKTLRRFFSLCGVTWELRMKKKSNQKDVVDVWLFHDIKDRSISLGSESRVEHCECLGGPVKAKGQVLKGMKLSANITEEDGWKIFDDLKMTRNMLFEITMLVSHDVGTR